MFDIRFAKLNESTNTLCITVYCDIEFPTLLKRLSNEPSVKGYYYDTIDHLCELSFDLNKITVDKCYIVVNSVFKE